MEFGLKWAHMARYGVILRLDGALWLLDPKKGHQNPKSIKKLVSSPGEDNKIRTLLQWPTGGEDVCTTTLAGDLGIWKSGNLEIWRPENGNFGSKKSKKMPLPSNQQLKNQSF